MQEEMMMEMSDADIDRVSGGDRWAGTAAGRAPAGGVGESTFGQICVVTGVIALVLAVSLF